MSLMQRNHNLSYSNKKITPEKRLEYSFEWKNNKIQQSLMNSSQDKNVLKQNLQKQCLIKKLTRQNQDLIEELQQTNSELQIKNQQLKQYKLQNKKLKLSLNHAIDVNKELEKTKHSVEKNITKLQQQPSFSNNKQLSNLKENFNRMKLQLQQKCNKLKELQAAIQQLTKQRIKFKAQSEILLKYKKEVSISERQVQQIEQIVITIQKNYKEQLQKNNDYIQQLNKQLIAKEQKIGQLEILLFQKEDQILQLQQSNKNLERQQKTKDQNIEKLLNQYQEILRYGCQAFQIKLENDISLMEIVKKAKKLLKTSNQLLCSQRNQYSKKANEYQIQYKQKLQLLQQQIRFLKVQLDSNVNFQKNIDKELDKIGSKTNIFNSIRRKSSQASTNISSNTPLENFQSKKRNQSASMIKLNQLKRHNSLNKFLYNETPKQKVSMEQLLYKKCKQIIF